MRFMVAVERTGAESDGDTALFQRIAGMAHADAEVNFHVGREMQGELIHAADDFVDEPLEGTVRILGRFLTGGSVFRAAAWFSDGSSDTGDVGDGEGNELAIEFESFLIHVGGDERIGANGDVGEVSEGEEFAAELVQAIDEAIDGRFAGSDVLFAELAPGFGLQGKEKVSRAVTQKNRESQRAGATHRARAAVAFADLRAPVAGQIQRAAAAPLSSGRVLKARAACGAPRWMALTTASNRTKRLGGRRTTAPITTQS